MRLMIVFLVGVTMGSALISLGSEPAAALLASRRPLLVGHRGYSAFAPENTVPSFRLALAAGADLVELDYHHTSDGIPIVIHDGTLDRTTDATNRWGGSKLAVGSYPLRQLRGLDAGSWYGSQWAGTRLSTLEEALEVIQADGVTLIERKGGDPATIVRLLRDRAWINQVVVQSFDWQYLHDLHALEPRQILGALGPPGRMADGRDPADLPKPLSRDWLDELVKTGARLVVWNREVDAESVRLAHDRGLKVWIYTVNEAGLANELLDSGVDGLITDNVSMLWRALALWGFSGNGAAPLAAE